MQFYGVSFRNRALFAARKKPAAFFAKTLDFPAGMWYTVFRDFGQLKSAIRKRIEVVITALTRNQVARKGSWVRIPPLPPKGNNTNTETKSGFVLFFSNDYFGMKIELWILTTAVGRKQSLGFFMLYETSVFFTFKYELAICLYYLMFFKFSTNIYLMLRIISYCATIASERIYPEDTVRTVIRALSLLPNKSFLYR